MANFNNVMEITQYKDVLQKLSNAEAGDLIHGLIEYQNNKPYSFEYSAVKIIFDSIIQEIERKRAISAKRSIIGKKGMQSRYSNK